MLYNIMVVDRAVAVCCLRMHVGTGHVEDNLCVSSDAAWAGCELALWHENLSGILIS